MLWITWLYQGWRHMRKVFANGLCFGKVLLVTFLLFSIETVLAENNVGTYLASGEFNAASKKNRADIARDILKHVNSLDLFIPNPTPDEMKWIKSEQSEINRIDRTKDSAFMARYLNLHETAEFQ